MALLEGQIRKQIAAGFKGRLLKGTLRNFNVAESSALDAFGDPVDAPTPIDIAVEGLGSEYDEMFRVRAGIPETDLKIVLIAGSFTGTPAKSSKVRFSGTSPFSNRWFQVRKVGQDPAGATWVLQCYEVADGSTLA